MAEKGKRVGAGEDILTTAASVRGSLSPHVQLPNLEGEELNCTCVVRMSTDTVRKESKLHVPCQINTTRQELQK